MKNFYAGTFMNREELGKVGIFYPIKLEYYKVTEEKAGREVYGVEIVKTKYREEKPEVEREMELGITNQETVINHFLNILKEGEVTPTQLEYIVQDIVKKEEERKIYLEA